MPSRARRTASRPSISPRSFGHGPRQGMRWSIPAQSRTRKNWASTSNRRLTTITRPWLYPTMSLFHPNTGSVARKGSRYCGSMPTVMGLRCKPVARMTNQAPDCLACRLNSSGGSSGCRTTKTTTPKRERKAWNRRGARKPRRPDADLS